MLFVVKLDEIGRVLIRETVRLWHILSRFMELSVFIWIYAVCLKECLKRGLFISFEPILFGFGGILLVLIFFPLLLPGLPANPPKEKLDRWSFKM